MTAWDAMLKRCAALNEALDLRREDFPPVLVARLPAECSMIVGGEVLTTDPGAKVADLAREKP